MEIAFTAACALLPSLLLLRYFYKRDLNPEPRSVLIWTFVLGVLIVIPVVIIALPLILFVPSLPGPLLQGLYIGFVTAAIPEELCKFAVVTGYSARNKAFDEPMDGVVYGAVASLGFATFENVLYVAGGGWVIALVRAFSAVPMHACLGAILGYYVGQARFNKIRPVSVWRGLITAIFIHGIYDFGLLAAMLMTSEGDFQALSPQTAFVAISLLGVAVAALIASVVWTALIVSRLRREQLDAAKQIQDETELRSPDEYRNP